MSRQLTGRQALVTGGSRGLGRAMAAALSAAGAEVSIIGRDPASLADAVKAGAATRFAVADVTDEAALLAAIAGLAEARPFDIAIANAGSAVIAPFLKTDAARLRAMLDLNLVSVATTFRAVLPAMLERRYGRLIAIASTAGHRGYANASAYSAAKHAVLGLVKSLALEIAGSGVTVNAISPGYADTDLVAGAVAGIASRKGVSAEAALAGFTADNPMGRLIAPEEVAAAALYLASPSSGGINGQSLLINGGEF
jgi:3-hydroxybutyrate dehydrogenase